MNQTHRCNTSPDQSPGHCALLLHCVTIRISQMFASASFCSIDTYWICHNVARVHLFYVHLIIYKEITFSLAIRGGKFGGRQAISGL